MEPTVIREEVQAFLQACQSFTGFALYMGLSLFVNRWLVKQSFPLRASNEHFPYQSMTLPILFASLS